MVHFLFTHDLIKISARYSILVEGEAKVKCYILGRLVIPYCIVIHNTLARSYCTELPPITLYLLGGQGDLQDFAFHLRPTTEMKMNYQFCRRLERKQRRCEAIFAIKGMCMFERSFYMYQTVKPVWPGQDMDRN